MGGGIDITVLFLSCETEDIRPLVHAVVDVSVLRNTKHHVEIDVCRHGGSPDLPPTWISHGQAMEFADNAVGIIVLRRYLAQPRQRIQLPC